MRLKCWGMRNTWLLSAGLAPGSMAAIAWRCRWLTSSSGACCDGLTATGVNRNQGAESTFAWLWTQMSNLKSRNCMAAATGLRLLTSELTGCSGEGCCLRTVLHSEPTEKQLFKQLQVSNIMEAKSHGGPLTRLPGPSGGILNGCGSTGRTNLTRSFDAASISISRAMDSEAATAHECT